MSRLSQTHDLVDVAREIERADILLGTSVNAKLTVIADQIRSLQNQAKEVLERAARDAELHRAACTFQKRVGQIYHLYEREGGVEYFSLLSVDDWNGSPPHRYSGSFRLEVDMSWTRTDHSSTIE